MKLNELNAYIARESLRFECPQASRLLEMANLVAFRMGDDGSDIVSIGEAPAVDPPENIGEYSLLWHSEADDAYYEFAINHYDLNIDNARMFLAEIYRKFLAEDWPFEHVKKKDFENIALNIWMPDDYAEYMDAKLQLEFEHLLQTSTRIGKLTINGTESRWKPSDIRKAENGFIGSFILSMILPFLLIPVIAPFLPNIGNSNIGWGIWCLWGLGLVSYFFIVTNIVNALGVLLMQMLLPRDLLQFVFDINLTGPVYEKSAPITHWLVSKILFPGRSIYL